ncbi:MAG TPA: ABC transporter permease, partial [Saprospiraceae bacterium]|nr:ABC transporter permease [Saprospiraceae bacterium]
MNRTIIEPSKSSLKIPVRELYEYRELISVLALRDFRIKYAQTFIGFLWAFINPLFTLLILHFVFGMVVQVETGETPHVIFTLAGLIGWNYFATLVSEAGHSIISAQDMIKKIYFPRLVIPISKALTGLIDFGAVLICFFLLLFYYQYMPSKNIIFLPFFLVMVIITGLAGGVWISALTTRFRDFQHIVPFLLRLGMFATPIAYSAESVPEKYQFIFQLNPLVGLIEGLRWCIIGG